MSISLGAQTAPRTRTGRGLASLPRMLPLDVLDDVGPFRLERVHARRRPRHIGLCADNVGGESIEIRRVEECLKPRLQGAALVGRTADDDVTTVPEEVALNVVH